MNKDFIKMVGGTEKQKEYAEIIRDRSFKYKLKGDFLKGFDRMKDDIIEYGKGDTYADKINYMLIYAAKKKNNSKFWINNNHPYSLVRMTLKELKSDRGYLENRNKYFLPTLKGTGSSAAANFRKKLIAIDINDKYISSLDHIQFNHLKKLVDNDGKLDKEQLFTEMKIKAEKIKLDFIENETESRIWILNMNDNFRYLLSGRKLTTDSNPRLLNQARKKQRSLAKEF